MSNIGDNIGDRHHKKTVVRFCPYQKDKTYDWMAIAGIMRVSKLLGALFLLLDFYRSWNTGENNLGMSLRLIVNRQS